MSTFVSSSEPRLHAESAGKSSRVTYSVLIPVFNSVQIVGQTIDTLVAVMEQHGLDYELVLVNDGSRDRSWSVLQEKAGSNPNIIAINLLRNYGQHVANLCGLRHTSGDYVITMDDDLQNPPEEILHLIAKAEEGHDVVFGEFRVKRHGLSRRLGSRLISMVNRRVFGQPKTLSVSNFRILRKDVVERICRYKTHYPYITGLAVMLSQNPAHVPVEHRPRPVGKSNYNLFSISKLVLTILLSYSAFPLHVAAFTGILTAFFSFVLGIGVLIHRFVRGTEVPGWTTLAVLVAFFSGIILLMLSMLGEYVVRLIHQSSIEHPYEVVETVGRRG
jgi:glycosyltransferase involved in cell wall biosynthesis